MINYDSPQGSPSALQEPRALAFHARDDALAPLEMTPEALLRGWRRGTQQQRAHKLRAGAVPSGNI